MIILLPALAGCGNQLFATEKMTVPTPEKPQQKLLPRMKRRRKKHRLC